MIQDRCPSQNHVELFRWPLGVDRVGNFRVRGQKQRKIHPGVGTPPPEDPGRLVCGCSEKANYVALLPLGLRIPAVLWLGS